MSDTRAKTRKRVVDAKQVMTVLTNDVVDDVEISSSSQNAKLYCTLYNFNSPKNVSKLPANSQCMLSLFRYRSPKLSMLVCFFGADDRCRTHLNADPPMRDVHLQ